MTRSGNMWRDWKLLCFEEWLLLERIFNEYVIRNRFVKRKNRSKSSIIFEFQKFNRKILLSSLFSRTDRSDFSHRLFRNFHRIFNRNRNYYLNPGAATSNSPPEIDSPKAELQQRLASIVEFYWNPGKVV